jgi:DNA polymerase-3 subunit gamma/tau
MDYPLPINIDSDYAHRFRPSSFGGILGNKETIVSLSKIVTDPNQPRTLLFYGQSGCGKTTSARVLSMALNCQKNRVEADPCGSCSPCSRILSGNGNMYGVYEINASDARGIDDIRLIRDSITSHAMFSENKIYILDEAHQLTKDAQNSLLKILEDTPDKVYFILCSTDPDKLIPTIRNRCHKYLFSPPTEGELINLLTWVCSLEGIVLGNKEDVNAIFKELISVSNSCPRAVLVGLQSIVSSCGLEEKEKALSLIRGYVSGEDIGVVDVARSLYSKKGWREIITVYKNSGAPPEAVRLVTAGYFRTLLEKAFTQTDMEKYSTLLGFFIEPLFDSKPENKLVLSLYKAYTYINERTF